MARIRSLKPEFWTSEQVVECTRDARLLFLGMLNFADDSGVLPGSVRRLRMQVFPGDDMTLEFLRGLVNELLRVDLLQEYDVEGRVYWRITGFKAHQRIDQPTCRHPLPDGTVPGKDRRIAGKQRQLILSKLIDRDGKECRHCGTTEDIAIDHITPRSKGGTDDIENLQLLCRRCNTRKLNK